MTGKAKPNEQEQVQDATPLQVIDERLYRIENRLHAIEEQTKPPEPITPSTGIFSRVVRRSYSEAEMHKAISNLVASKKYQDDDDPIEILVDAVNELLVLRDIKERVAQQSLQWQTELRRP